jgi:hypothetical protein
VDNIILDVADRIGAIILFRLYRMKKPMRRIFYLLVSMIVLGSVQMIFLDLALEAFPWAKTTLDWLPFRMMLLLLAIYGVPQMGNVFVLHLEPVFDGSED